ncbi:MAG: hypothetical protein KGN02_02510 [bacterium]|nr:hypothetical protein [bacterium]
MKLTRVIAAASVAALLAGCGGGGSNGGAVPSTSQTNIGGSKLQIAVGTAFNAADGATGLNVVATFRGTNGLSATLANTPTITGPAGFTVPAGFGGAYGPGSVDEGTSHISASPQVNVNTAAANTTLGAFTGVFSYGLAPLNSDQQGAEGYFPGNPNATPVNGFASSAYNYLANVGLTAPFWAQPFGAATQGTYLLGPPAVPFFNDGTFPGGFAGYSPGFTAFQLTPVAGTYSMNAVVSSTNAPSQTFSATSNALANLTPLPAPVVSGVTENGGGLTGTVTVGAGVQETLVFINDSTSNYFYTVEVTGTGAQTFTLPALLGPCAGKGCQTTSSATASIPAGDAYTVTAISFDYPALEDGPPGNTSQAPTLVGATGQADLSIGVPVTGTY